MKNKNIGGIGFLVPLFIAVLTMASTGCSMLLSSEDSGDSSFEDSKEVSDEDKDTEEDVEADPSIAPGAVIVAVEGLSFVNTFIGELASLSGVSPQPMEDRDTYLSESLSSLLSDDRFEIFSFRWSGNASGDTGTILKDVGEYSLRQFLREKKQYALTQGLPLIVVGHSWGTVLTYLALSLEAAESDPLELDLYITLSSPIGTAFGHPGTYAEEAVITEYLQDWFDTLGFQTNETFRPRAGIFANFWAWGDFISGPLSPFVPELSNLMDIRVDEGLFDLPTDSSYSRTAAYSNRNLLDARYWHKFTTADPIVLTDEYEDYLAQDFIRDADIAFYALQGKLKNMIHALSGLERDSTKDLVIGISGITVMDEREGDGIFNPADDYAEYFGYFSVSLDGEKRLVKRMRSENDYVSLQKEDYHPINWEQVLSIDGTGKTVTITAELYEDELGDDDDFPGYGSATIDISGLNATTLPHSGSFDVSWLDATAGINVLRVHYFIRKAG